MKHKTLPLGPGDYVEYSNGPGVSPSRGHIVKAHPRSGSTGTYEIKPSDGHRNVTRKAIHAHKAKE